MFKRPKIDKGLLSICPDIRLGCITYSIDAMDENNDLWDLINEEISFIENNMMIEDIYKYENITNSREFYKKLGKDPSRYRISSEALLRRIVRKKGLYKVNSVVDANNLISIKSKLSVGSYDLDKIGNDLVFRIGDKNESYKGIGKDIINTENLPVFSDEKGAYGSPTSDSQRAMITNDTKNVLTVLIAFSDVDLENYLKDATEILENYVGAFDISTCVVKKEDD